MPDALLIAPSLLAADATRLGEAVAAVEDAGADWLHIDIMDGHFVPNLTFGPHTVAALRRQSRLFFDCHLMLQPALPQVEAFARAGADLISVHVESEADVGATLAAIRACGKQCGLALKPGTPLDAALPYLSQIDLLLIMTVEPGFGGQAFRSDQLPKLQAARDLIRAHGYTIRIEADGGVTANNAAAVIAAGADVLVAGTAIFGVDDHEQAIASLRGAG